MGKTKFYSEPKRGKFKGEKNTIIVKNALENSVVFLPRRNDGVAAQIEKIGFQKRRNRKRKEGGKCDLCIRFFFFFYVTFFFLPLQSSSRMAEVCTPLSSENLEEW